MYSIYIYTHVWYYIDARTTGMGYANYVDYSLAEERMGNDGKTIWQALPWLKTMLDYTDKVCAGIKEEDGDLRAADPQGGYVFSVKELLLHIADSRWQCYTWLVGGEEQERFQAESFCNEYGGTENPWDFREASVADALNRLRESREKLESWLDRPAAEMLGTTEALRHTHEKFIERLREAGKDIAEMEAAGPGGVVNSLLFLTGHEQAHRAVLQHMLRIHGKDVYRIA